MTPKRSGSWGDIALTSVHHKSILPSPRRVGQRDPDQLSTEAISATPTVSCPPCAGGSSHPQGGLRPGALKYSVLVLCWFVDGARLVQLAVGDAFVARGRSASLGGTPQGCEVSF